MLATSWTRISKNQQVKTQQMKLFNIRGWMAQSHFQCSPSKNFFEIWCRFIIPILVFFHVPNPLPVLLMNLCRESSSFGESHPSWLSILMHARTIISNYLCESVLFLKALTHVARIRISEMKETWWNGAFIDYEIQIFARFLNVFPVTYLLHMLHSWMSTW